jgi:hypothetical protein
VIGDLGLARRSLARLSEPPLRHLIKLINLSSHRYDTAPAIEQAFI